MKKSTKVAQAIVGSGGGDRPKGDFYPTPAYATEKLLEVEDFPGEIWEPACGDGSMAKVLPPPVVATDLHDWGYGETGVDFFMTWRKTDNIVTNPPYSLAQQFVERALLLARNKAAFLLKLTFLESQSRYHFFRRTPLRTVHVFSKRLNMTKEGEELEGSSGGMIAFAWFIWEKGYTGLPYLNWLL